MATLNSLNVPLTPAWTKKSDSNEVWIWLTGWFSTENLSGLRAALELRATSGNLSVRFGYQTSDDQVNVNSPAGFGTARTTEGYFVDTSYTDISTACDGALYIRFGVLVKNQTSGTTLEMCRVGGRLDFK